MSEWLHFIMTMATLPGIVVSLILRWGICVGCKVRVKQMYFFRRQRPFYQFLYEKPWAVIEHSVMEAGMFCIIAIAGIIIAFGPSIEIWQFRSGNLMDYLLLWTGISVVMHAFPTEDTARSLLGESNQRALDKKRKKTGNRIAQVIAYFLYFSSLGSAFFVQLLYALFITAFIPVFILRFIAMACLLFGL